MLTQQDPDASSNVSASAPSSHMQAHRTYLRRQVVTLLHFQAASSQDLDKNKSRFFAPPSFWLAFERMNADVCTSPALPKWDPISFGLFGRKEARGVLYETFQGDIAASAQDLYFCSQNTTRIAAADGQPIRRHSRRPVPNHSVSPLPLGMPITAPRPAFATTGENRSFEICPAPRVGLTRHTRPISTKACSPPVLPVNPHAL